VEETYINEQRSHRNENDYENIIGLKRIKSYYPYQQNTPPFLGVSDIKNSKIKYVFLEISESKQNTLR